MTGKLSVLIIFISLLLIGFQITVLGQEPLYTQCTGDNGIATCGIYYNDSPPPQYIISSITISVTNMATITMVYDQNVDPSVMIWSGSTFGPLTIDVDDFVLSEIGAVYRIYYEEAGFHQFFISYTAEQAQPTATPTATVEPTATPTATPTAEPYNEWGEALSSTTFTQDFENTMAQKLEDEGGIVGAAGAIDFAPFEIPEPSVDLPALSLTVADISMMAKSATTLWALIDNIGVLPFYMLIAIALALVWWLYRFVTDLPTPAPDIDLTGAFDTYTGYDDYLANQDIEYEESVRAGIDARGGRNTGLGQSLYDDSLARSESAKERKRLNSQRRGAAKGAVRANKRFKNLF